MGALRWRRLFFFQMLVRNLSIYLRKWNYNTKIPGVEVSAQLCQHAQTAHHKMHAAFDCNAVWSLPFVKMMSHLRKMKVQRPDDGFGSNVKQWIYTCARSLTQMSQGSWIYVFSEIIRCDSAPFFVLPSCHKFGRIQLRFWDFLDSLCMFVLQVCLVLRHSYW